MHGARSSVGTTATFVNGDQAFPLNVTTEYWRVINEVATDNLDPKAAAGELQKFIAEREIAFLPLGRPLIGGRSASFARQSPIGRAIAGW